MSSFRLCLALFRPACNPFINPPCVSTVLQIVIYPPASTVIMKTGSNPFLLVPNYSKIMLYYEPFVLMRVVTLPVVGNANEKNEFTVDERSSYLLLRLLERFLQPRQVNPCVDVTRVRQRV